MTGTKVGFFVLKFPTPPRKIMSTIRLPLFASLAALLLAAPLPVLAAPATGADETVYVSIDSPELISFARFRLARENGDELILSTLQSAAAEQAHFSGYPGKVIVLDEQASAPAGAKVLMLTWSDGVVFATLMQNGREQSLGVVSRNQLSEHPDYQAMRREIDRHQLREARRDAELRAATQMNLYQALKYLQQKQAA